MREKIKVLSSNTKKNGKQSKRSSIALAESLEQYAPGMYTFSEAYTAEAIETGG